MPNLGTFFLVILYIRQNRKRMCKFMSFTFFSDFLMIANLLTLISILALIIIFFIINKLSKKLDFIKLIILSTLIGIGLGAGSLINI